MVYEDLKKEVKNSNKVSFGNKIGKYIHLHGLTVAEFARMTDFDYTYIQAVIDRGSLPREKNRKQMIDKLGCTWDDLFYEVAS